MYYYYYYINTNEIPGELSRENMISSHIKITCYFHVRISPLLWLHNKSRLPQDKTSFFLRVLKIFHSFSAFTREIFFQHSKKNLVSPRGHVISSIFVLTSGILW